MSENKGPYQVEVTLVGLEPGIIFNRMTEETLQALLESKSVPKVTDVSLLDRAGPQLYRDDNGKIGFPGENIFACLAEAGRHVKYDAKKKISTAGATLLPSFFTLDTAFMGMKITTPKAILTRIKKKHPNRVSSENWVVDLRKGNLNNGGKKVAVCLCRPKIHSWEGKLRFTLNLDGHPVKEATIKELFNVAGSMVGFASFRPSCKGVFGRFRIKDWKVVKGARKSKTGS